MIGCSQEVVTVYMQRDGYIINTMEILPLTRFGNPVLRKKARELTPDEIRSQEVQWLIANMRYTLRKNKYGVGLAAPQVGESVQLSVIDIKPTPTRPNLETFTTVLINPQIIDHSEEAVPMWEGCVSCGTGDDILYAQAMRYSEVTVQWCDEYACEQKQKLGGFVAHVAQHEIDHLNGVLFVDRVADPATFIMADEYRKRIVGA